MSRGYGKLQRALIEAFREPGARYTTIELAARIYGLPVKHWHIVNVNRALENSARELGLTSWRSGAQGVGGWRHVWGRT